MPQGGAHSFFIDRAHIFSFPAHSKSSALLRRYFRLRLEYDRGVNFVGICETDRFCCTSVFRLHLLERTGIERPHGTPCHTYGEFAFLPAIQAEVALLHLG